MLQQQYSYSRRKSKAWDKHVRKCNEYHNDVRLNDICDYLSSSIPRSKYFSK